MINNIQNIFSIIFYKNYISKGENSDTEQAKRVPTLEEQINNEYNYDKSDSDDEGKKEKKKYVIANEYIDIETKEMFEKDKNGNFTKINEGKEI